MLLTFKMTDGWTCELNFDDDPTIGDIKQALENAYSQHHVINVQGIIRHQNLSRDHYSVLVSHSHKRMFINENTMEKLSQYLSRKKITDFDGVLPVVSNLGNAEYFCCREDIELLDEQIKEIGSQLSIDLACPITKTLIARIPVKINGHYYDYNAFLQYLKVVKIRFDSSANEAFLIDPLGIGLNEELLNLFRTCQDFDREAYCCLRRNYLRTFGEYDHDIAILKEEVGSILQRNAAARCLQRFFRQHRLQQQDPQAPAASLGARNT